MRTTPRPLPLSRLCKKTNRTLKKATDRYKGTRRPDNGQRLPHKKRTRTDAVASYTRTEEDQKGPHRTPRKEISGERELCGAIDHAAEPLSFFSTDYWGLPLGSIPKTNRETDCAHRRFFRTTKEGKNSRSGETGGRREVKTRGTLLAVHVWGEAGNPAGHRLL